MSVANPTGLEKATNFDAAIHAHVMFSPNTPDTLGSSGSLTRQQVPGFTQQESGAGDKTQHRHPGSHFK